MTDADQSTIGLRVPSELADAPLVAGAPSAGQQLQRARLDAGLSLESLSARLKVSVPRLQAFENDQFEQGPNLHTGRAMVASVARFLGLDAPALLAQLPQPKPPSSVPAMQDAMAGFSKGSRLRMRRDERGPIAPTWWIAWALLVLAGLVYFYPQITELINRVPAAAPQEMAVPAVPAPQAVPDVAAEQVAPAPLPIAPIPEAPVVPAGLDRNVSAAKAVQAVLVFKARASTWIEVTDAKGAVMLRRTLGAAESAEVGGDLPLSVVIGRADHTEVFVRGAVFPLETHTQDNVARFKVP
jgi:cytoskeleton protein RodZ